MTPTGETFYCPHMTERRKQIRYTLQERENALFRSALAVMLERQGGAMTYTQTEFAAVKGKRGPYVMRGLVDQSGDGEPTVRVELVPDERATPDPVN